MMHGQKKTSKNRNTSIQKQLHVSVTCDHYRDIMQCLREGKV